jgi:glycosyltransferase involved in cell wall biosynthesis
MKIKISLVRSPIFNKYGGIEKHCAELINLFSKKNDEFELSTLNIKSKKLKLFKKFTYDWDDFKNKLKRSNCDIVHIHGFASPIIPRAIAISKQFNKKIIYTPHYHPFETLRNPLLAKLFFYTMLKPKIKYLSRIITINNDEFVFFNRFFNRVSQIPHWITEDTSTYPPYPKDHKMLLFVGRNEKNKGIDHLYNLPKNKYNMHCVTNKKLNRSDFTYHKNIENDKLDILYKKTSLVIIPSRYEAFSLVALEALSHGTPVLVSDKVRIADHLHECDGFFVFKYGDYNDFMLKIEQAKNSQTNSLKIKNIFSAGKALENYSKIYQMVMRKR